MLVSKEKAKKIVADCELVKTTTTPYSRKVLVDITQYIGKYGGGFIVKHNKKADIYVYKNNIVNTEIYNGKYSVKDAVMASNTLKTILYNGVRVTPTWELKLDTVDGTIHYKVTEEYRPIYHAGRTLTVCWYGSIKEDFLRRKIRRKLKEVIMSGQAQEV